MLIPADPRLADLQFLYMIGKMLVHKKAQRQQPIRMSAQNIENLLRYDSWIVIIGETSVEVVYEDPIRIEDVGINKNFEV